MKELFVERKFAVMLTLIILIAGSIYYFGARLAKPSMGETKDTAIFGDLRIKAAYTPDGKLKIFALAKNNQIAKLESTEGSSIPESNSIVIGANEAAMMKVS